MRRKDRLIPDAAIEPRHDNMKTPATNPGVFFSSPAAPAASITPDPQADAQLLFDALQAPASRTLDDSGALDSLLSAADLWRGNQLASGPGQVYATGYPALDAKLPGGGWPVAGLTELLSAHNGVGELRLLMPGLARLAADKSGWIVWIAPPYMPNAPALMQWGIAPDRVLLIHPRSAADAAWAAEQALGSGTCIAVLLWSSILESGAGISAGKRRLSMTQFSRRLQLAAATGECWAIALRHSDAGQQPSAAMLRLAIETDEDRRDLRLLKVRGGQPTLIRDFDAGIDIGAMMIDPVTDADSERH